MSDEPVWIHKLMLLAIHGRQAAEHGAKDEAYDEALLQAALERPQRKFKNNPPPDLAALAAALPYDLIRNRVFANNNEPIAAVACEMFLELNGFGLNASNTDIVRTFLRLAVGEIDERALAAWVRQHLAPPHGRSVQEPAATYVA